LKTNTTSTTTTRTRPRPGYNTTGHHPPHDYLIATKPPLDLPPFGEKLLARLVERFEALHNQIVKEKDLTNLAEYKRLDAQITHIHEQYEQAAAAGDIGSKGAGNDFF
jgi:hypothetical protein